MVSGSHVSAPYRALRSPVPLLLAGLVAGLILIVIATVPQRTATPDQTKVPTLSSAEALTIVAEKMRAGTAAQEVSGQGQAQFNDGAWTITVGDARFSFTQRNRIVVPENDAARSLEFGDGTGGPTSSAPPPSS